MRHYTILEDSAQHDTVPAGPPGWKEDLICPPGLLNVGAGATLPFLGVGAAADLEYVFAAGDVCNMGVALSTASLRKDMHTLYKL